MTIADTFFTFLSEIKWPRVQAFINGGIYYRLVEADHDKLRELLKPNYYIILTRRSCHLTTYLTELGNLYTTGKLGYYSHALMNVDDGTALRDVEYKFLEATEPGVHYSTFMEVFDCDSVALLRPKGFTDADWTATLDKALTDYGKPYDNLFDVTQNQHLDCVELVRDALKGDPDYDVKFLSLEVMIKQYGNKLTPDMLYNCPAFEVVFEIKR